MSRVIKLEGSGKERKKLTREIVLAVRELMTQQEVNEKTRDLAAFISIALEEISNTIEGSVAAWEKRGYWIKADRYRLDWEWCDFLGKAMRDAVLEEDWQTVATTAARIAGKLNTVVLPQRHQLGEPWIGARKRLHEGKNQTSSKKT